MYLGACKCKSVRYQFTGKPLTCYACHCTDCQTSSGSAFEMSMIANSKDIEIVEGELAIDTKDYNGTVVQQHYCGQCGIVLWYSTDKYPGFIALKPGTFDDTTWFSPIAHLWVRSAQPWIKLDSSTAKYEKQPEIIELIELWSKSEMA